MISVLIPTTNIYKTIDTINNITECCAGIETIVRFENTDIESLSKIEKLPNTRYIIGDCLPRHDELNELCHVANGDILLPMNEDTKIFTPGWDFVKVPDIAVVHFGDLIGITRGLYNILGHFTLHPEYQSYVAGIGELCKIGVQVPVQVETKREELKKEDEHSFKSRGIQTLIRLDASRVNEHITD